MKKQKLYPLKFNPISKERIWGGNNLNTLFNKPNGNTDASIGETWEIVGFEEESSIIAEGYLEGNSLYETMEIYMGDLVGEENYKFYGNEFPLLVKLLDINDLHSVQVHPNDETAFDRHDSYGKTEAWYILDAEEDAKVYMGFNRDITPTEFYERCKNNTLEEVLNVYHPKKGDFFFVEAGIIHSGGGGLVIAEVQQLSDVTYRVYDWGRENDPKTAREMHLDLSIDSINYNKYDESKYYFPAGPIKGNTLLECEYFTINKLTLDTPISVSTEEKGRFLIYFCVSGSFDIITDSDNSKYSSKQGECILVPASFEDYSISSSDGAEVLEIFIPEPTVEEDFTITE